MLTHRQYEVLYQVWVCKKHHLIWIGDVYWSTRTLFPLRTLDGDGWRTYKAFVLQLIRRGYLKPACCTQDPIYLGYRMTALGRKAFKRYCRRYHMPIPYWYTATDRLLDYLEACSKTGSPIFPGHDRWKVTHE